MTGAVLPNRSISERAIFAGWHAEMRALQALVAEASVWLAVAISGLIPSAVPSIDFVSRVTALVIMLNGRYDAIEPHESSQLPILRLLGTPPEQKRQVVFDNGHGPIPKNALIKEVLDWLGKFPWPVK